MFFFVRQTNGFFFLSQANTTEKTQFCCCCCCQSCSHHNISTFFVQVSNCISTKLCIFFFKFQMVCSLFSIMRTFFWTTTTTTNYAFNLSKSESVFILLLLNVCESILKMYLCMSVYISGTSTFLCWSRYGIFRDFHHLFFFFFSIVGLIEKHFSKEKKIKHITL